MNKRRYDIGKILLPLGLLAFLIWLHGEKPHGEKPVGESTPATTTLSEGKSASADSPNHTSTAAALISSNAAPLWTLSDSPEGNANGLRPAIAAASRGRNELPEGRRWKMENFPDLRSLKEGQRVTVPLPDGREFTGTVFYSRLDEGYKNRHLLSIGFDGEKGNLFVTNDAPELRRYGRLLVTGDRKAWTFTAEKNEDVWLREHWREDLICELPPVPVAALRSDVLPGDPGVSDYGATAPFLNSRPLASGALFIDFDGEPETVYPDWGSCVSAKPYEVPHSGLNASQMTFIWRRVAEDFSPFNINVTTSEDVYDAAPVGKRMRILIGATLPPCVRGFGVAIMNSFRNTGSSRVPCWMSTDSYGGALIDEGSMAAMASNISHEFGHAMGLWHDGMYAAQPSDSAPGSSYYPGHGNLPLDWSPIMGGPYRPGGGARAVIQWAKDEYPGANNAQDDIAVIASPANGVGLAPDESTDYANALVLTPLTLGRVGASGVISRDADFDYWQFTVNFAGNGTVEMAPADLGLSCANLDCGFYIADSTLTPITVIYDSVNSLEATVVRHFTPGTYYIVAFGQGNLQASDSTGYSGYGSLGRYVVTVQPPVDGIVPTVAITHPAQNAILSGGSIAFQGTASDNNAISNIELHLRRDADGSYWNGSYWQTGMEGAALNNTYNAVTQTWVCTSPLPQVGGAVSGFSPGSYTFMARAYDLGALYSDTTSVVSVDATGPNVTILTPLSGSLLGTPGLSFTGTATENGTLQYVVGYIRRNTDGNYWNGSSWQTGSSGANLTCNVVQRPASTIYDWTCTATLPSLGSTLTPGSYTFIAIAVDGVGLQQQRDAVINVDGTPPVTALAAPLHQSIITSGSVPFHGTIADNAGVWRVVCFIRRHADNLYWNGSAWIADPGAANLSTSYNGGNGTWTCTATLPQPGSTLANGGYNFIALGFDHAGNFHQVDSVVTVDFHQTYVWNGTAGGAWENAGSWTPNGIPGEDDYVLINNGGTVTNNAIRSVYGFRVVNGTMTSSAGNSLNFTNDSTWSGGAIGGIWHNAASSTIALNNTTVSSAPAGTVFNNYGLLRNDAGSTTLPISIQQQENGRIQNNGALLYLSGGGTHYPGSVLDAASGAIYLHGGTHTFEGGSFTGNNWTYCTGGTMLVQGDVGATTGAATGSFGISGGTVTGSGTVSAQRGHFSTGTLSGSVVLRFTSSFTKPTNTVFNMNGGTLQIDGLFESPGAADFNLDSAVGGGAGTIHNKGIWRCSNAFTYSNTGGNGVFRNEGLFESLAGISLIQSAFHSKPGSTFRSYAGYVRLNGGGIHDVGSTFDADGGDIYFSAGTHQLLGGTFTGSTYVYATGATVSVEGNVGASSGSASGGFGIAAGTITGTAMLSAERGLLLDGMINGMVTIRLTGQSSKVTNTNLDMNGGTIRNEGTMTAASGGNFNLDSIAGGGAGTIINTGIWRCSNAFTYSNTGGAGTFRNEGLFESLAGVSMIAGSFLSETGSTFRAKSGYVRLGGGGIHQPGATFDADGGDIYLSAGTHQLLGGTFIGPRYVYATGATVTVNGNVGTSSGAATGGFGIFAGTVNGSAMLSAERGYLQAGVIGGAVTIRLTGQSSKVANSNLDMNGGTIRNEGTMSQLASADFNLDSSSSAGAGTLVNTGTWNQTGGSNFSNSSGAGQIDNYGLWHISAGNSSSAAFFTHRADSIFRVTGGQMIFTGGGVMKADSTVAANGGAVYFNGGTQILEGGMITGESTVYCGIGSTNITGNVGATSGPAAGGFGIYNTGTLTGTAMLSVDHGYLAAGNIGGTVTLRFTGTSQKITNTLLNMSGGTIRNEGTMTQPASADFNLDSNAGTGAGTLLNTGTWNQTGGSNFSNSSGAGQIDNYGLWHISTGNSSNAAYFTHRANSIFRVAGGQMIFTGGGIMKADSIVDANGGDVYFNGGTQTLEGGAITGANTVFCGIGVTDVTGNVGATSGPATGGFGIYNSIGTLIGSAMLSVDHGYLAAGNIGGSVTFRLTGTSQKITNTVLNMSGGTILNDGTMNVAVSGDFNLDSNSGAGGGSIVNNGTWNHAGNCNINNTNLGGFMQNSGTFQINAGTTQVYAPFTNSGLTRVAAGSLFLRAGSTHTGGLVSNGSLTFIGSGHSLSGPNAFLGGSGSFSGNVSLTNASSIAPGNSPGTLSLFGTVQFLASTAAPAINMELASGTQFDQIILGNGASLALGTGVTDLLLDLQYQPTPGQTFRLVSAGTSTGSFNGRFRNAANTGDLVAANYQGIPYQFRVNYDPSSKFIDLVYQSGYQLWVSQMGLIGINGGFNADPDGDGIPNGIEFIIGGDPRPGFPDTTPHPNQNNPTIDETYVIFNYRRSQAARYLPTVVEYNRNLSVIWSQAQHGVSGVVINVSENFYGAGIDKVETKIPRSLATEGRIFVRLQSVE